MFRPIFIGDRVSACGFRLAGASVIVPQTGDEDRVFDEVLQHADLVMISAEIAARISTARLQQAQLRNNPLVLVLSDVRQHSASPDVAGRLRRVLGMST